MALRAVANAVLIWSASIAVAAEPPKPWFPAEPSCTVITAPADAVAVVTPGGFMLVHPRNDRIADDYSGCKTLWIYDDPDVPRRWATLRFAHGELVRAVIWRRDAQEVADRVCDRPASAQAPECSGVEGNELTALRLPSWPRVCATDPDRKECAQDPR
ncbi:hypothetical protein M2650_13400 [Luteimonas sp. SX5]|uniref:Secreted protein n=1 Tax=Luteimonas galliterrae TaxID=2940486 RepID=A0ABT0MLT3_9GAMM|nr:hypothetical protein [Luteimonas galliterrae]MCL1635618.1 hypothetical protein [Luteimonas galliterrae]